MQGDPRVDDLMRPVNAAIRRHVKDDAAVTDIYNRAYEAVMNSMDVNAPQVAALQTALDAANEDAARLASVLEDDGYPVKKLPMNAKRLSLAAHRARVGGAS